MLKALWSGTSGLYANQNKLDMISNNLANINTNGYKSSDVAFEDIFYNKMDRLGLPVTAADRQKLIEGSGVKADVAIKNFSQGDIQETGNDEDLAIEGNGFFKVTINGEAFYTRDGSFNIDSDGNFVHSSSGGILLQPDYSGLDSLKKPYRFKIEEDGTVNAYGQGSSNPVEVGKIEVVDFINKDDLIAAGNNLYKVNDANVSTEVPANFKIKQGYVEKSNVDITKQLTDMMVTQRAYQFNSKSIQAADEMMQIANNLRSK